METEFPRAPEFVYYLLHKPAGYVSATEDKRDRTVMELVAIRQERHVSGRKTGQRYGRTASDHR